MESLDISALPKRLKQLRLELGWSLDDLAQAIGAASKGVVSNWEALNERQRTPPLGTLMALARWYGVSMDYLVGVRSAERESPAVRAGKAALKERFPIEVKTLPSPTPTARLRLAVSILQEASPDGFFTGRIAANLLMSEADFLEMLQQKVIPGPALERFAHFAGIPPAWFRLKPEDI